MFKGALLGVEKRLDDLFGDRVDFIDEGDFVQEMISKTEQRIDK